MNEAQAESRQFHNSILTNAKRRQIEIWLSPIPRCGITQSIRIYSAPSTMPKRPATRRLFLLMLSATTVSASSGELRASRDTLRVLQGDKLDYSCDLSTDPCPTKYDGVCDDPQFGGSNPVCKNGDCWDCNYECKQNEEKYCSETRVGSF